MTIRNELPFTIIPEWLLDAEVSANAIRLYGVLHRYADKGTLEAHPSRRQLADRVRVSPDTIDRALKELIAVGAVVTEHRFGEGGHQRSNDYILRPGGRKGAEGRGRTHAATGAAPLRHEEPRATELEKADDLEEHFAFEAFWSAYPRKVGKGAALKAWRSALKRASPGEIGDGLARFLAAGLGDGDQRFIPHPSTWLNADRWADQYPAPPPAPEPYDPGPPGDPEGFAAAAAERPWKAGA